MYYVQYELLQHQMKRYFFSGVLFQNRFGLKTLFDKAEPPMTFGHDQLWSKCTHSYSELIKNRCYLTVKKMCTHNVITQKKTSVTWWTSNVSPNSGHFLGISRESLVDLFAFQFCVSVTVEDAWPTHREFHFRRTRSSVSRSSHEPP